MCYVPPTQRWDYVDSKATMVDTPRRFYFHDVKSIQHAELLHFEDMYWDSAFDDMIEYYRFVGSPKHRNYYYCGVAVLFTDGDLYLCVEIKCKNALSELEKFQFIRHKYKEILNPMNAVYMAAFDDTTFGLAALLPAFRRNGKWCFTALGGYLKNSHHDYKIVYWKKFVYIFNLYLIRKQSVFRIWKTWKLYKSRRANLFPH